MKTITKLRFAATLALAFAAALPLMADTDAAAETVDGIEWNYSVHGGKAEVGIGDYDGTRAVSNSTIGAIAIPSTLGGYPVTSIRSYAFYRCSRLTSVTMPASVTSIGGSAFYGCSGLTGVTIPAGVTSIGSYGSAFYGCSGLTGVTIPAGVTSIGVNTFYYCSGLKSVTMPASVTSIGAGAFESCSGLTSVTIPAGVTNIGFEAFYNCRGLTGVTIPARVTSIGDGAFQDCSGLKSVTILASVTSIGEDAFKGCSGLTSVMIPASVTSIGYSAFKGCSGLTSVTIPAGVTRIGWYAFEDCRGLASVTIPASVTSIGRYAFSNNVALKTVYVAIGDTDRVRGLLNDSGLDVSGITFAEIKMPDPVTPAPEPVTPGYVVIEPGDIREAFVAPKAVTLAGAVYDGNDVVGIVELKLGKVNDKKHTGKVSGSVTTLDGKKHTIKSFNVTGIGAASKAVSLEVKDFDKMNVTIGGTRFAGSMGTYHVQSADVGGAWAKSSATVHVTATSAALPAGTIEELLPDGETATVTGGKWTFKKAATVKLSKDKSTYLVDDANGKTNKSGLKLTYTPKKGTFKGSFKVYALEGAGKAKKLKKYTFNVSGVVVGGVGYGAATCKKPAVSWSVKVR